LDVIVRESATVFKLLSGEDESLLIWGDSFLVLDLGLDVFDGAGWRNVDGDGFPCESLDIYLHTTTTTA
jgi:hypothetical protein